MEKRTAQICGRGRSPAGSRGRRIVIKTEPLPQAGADTMGLHAVLPLESEGMTDVFASLTEAHSTQGPAALLDRLAEVFRERGEFNRLFEARLMKKRHELGLPLIPEGRDGAVARCD
jgi:hypothetical protein